MKKINYLILVWILSLIIAILWTYENPEKIKNIKNKLKLYVPKHKFENLNSDKNKDIFDSNNFILKL